MASMFNHQSNKIAGTKPILNANKQKNKTMLFPLLGNSLNLLYKYHFLWYKNEYNTGWTISKVLS